VFDIDETVLSNLPHMREMDFGYVADEWNAWWRGARRRR
jgi:predicted secreted acid phosphatase